MKKREIEVWWCGKDLGDWGEALASPHKTLFLKKLCYTPKNMQTQIKKLENLTWINLVKPEITEVRKILNEVGMNETLAEEIVYPTLKSKVDTLRNAVYLSLHFPFKKEEEIEKEEIDFLIKNNLIITSQYKEIKFINEYIEKINSNLNFHGGNYFAEFLKHFYKNLEISLSELELETKNIEKEIFHKDERTVIEEISQVSKKLIDYKTGLSNHPETLESFKNNSSQIFGEDYLKYSEIIYENSKNILDIINNQKMLIDDLKDTTNFLLTNKTNNLVKVFTVVSFIILPVSFMASFFGMNTRFPNDLVDSPFGTIYIMTLMFFTSLLILMYLHFKRFI